MHNKLKRKKISYQRYIKINPNKVLKPTYVLDTYWKFAKKRQDIFMSRVNGDAPPWTTDTILSTYKFTNVYRASDRVSQYLIQNVIYKGSQNYEEIFFRILLFKLFNKIETWEYLLENLGYIPNWKAFDLRRYEKLLNQLSKNKAVYSQAYIMPTPPFKKPKKLQNHLFLLKKMMEDKLPSKVVNSKSLRDVYELMKEQHSFGSFLAFQYTIDINYSDIINFDENDFVVAGGGAIRGIHKCFSNVDVNDYENIIYKMVEISDNEFKRLGLSFKNLFGRPLKLIDCQNLFCEVDKYSRVAHPEILSSCKKIKQKFSPNLKLPPQKYPSKWNLQIPESHINLDKKFESLTA